MEASSFFLPAGLSLDDVPKGWTQEVVLASKDALMPLFQTCTLLRDMILENHGCSLRLGLGEQGSVCRSGVECLGPDTAARCLALAAPHATHGIHLYQAADASDGDFIDHLQQLMLSAGPPYPNIQVLTMESVALQHFVPPSLILCCPNLHTVILIDAEIYVLDIETYPPMPQLTCLILENPCLVHFFMFSSICKRGLPSLTDLRVRLDLGMSLTDEMIEITGESWADCVVQLGPQLTRLDFLCFPAQRFYSEQLLEADLSQLRTLRLDRVVTDAMLERLLLAAPLVTELWVFGFQLRESHAEAASNWQQLYVAYLNVPALPLLPLRHVKHLAMATKRLNLSIESLEPGTSVPLPVIQAAVAAAAACGGVQFMDLRELHIHASAPSQVLAALPLIAGVPSSLHTLMLALREPACRDLLAALGTLPCTRLELQSHLLADAGCHLWEIMPRVTTIELRHAFGTRYPDDMLLQLCQSASRPVTLDVTWLMGPGPRLERLKGAAEKAGNWVAVTRAHLLLLDGVSQDVFPDLPDPTL